MKITTTNRWKLSRDNTALIPVLLWLIFTVNKPSTVHTTVLKDATRSQQKCEMNSAVTVTNSDKFKIINFYSLKNQCACGFVCLVLGIWLVLRVFGQGMLWTVSFYSLLNFGMGKWPRVFWTLFALSARFSPPHVILPDQDQGWRSSKTRKYSTLNSSLSDRSDLNYLINVWLWKAKLTWAYSQTLDERGTVEMVQRLSFQVGS